MALIDNRKELTSYIEANKKYTSHNIELFDIFEGNLKPYITQILKSSLTDHYFNQIKERIYPINILKRIIDKISRSYSMKPTRTATSNEDILEFYESAYMFNQQMNSADEYANLFKGYALEPFIINGIPSLRVLPFDRFLVESNNIIDPTIMSRFYKYVGKIPKTTRGHTTTVDLWFVYTNEEFIAIDSDGDVVPQFMQDDKSNLLEGENPLGFIPFFYGNRSKYKILPTQDTDTLALSKLLPVQISDLGGMILFQCFSIIYCIDIDEENMEMSPNALWSIKSDKKSDKNPQLGTIKPNADIDKVLTFVREVFSTWMESRGIRVGALGRTDGNYSFSGISKIIDEMDTFEAIIKQIEYFKKDEYAFWQLNKRMHNFWIDSGQLKQKTRLPDNWEVFTDFDSPRPAISRTQEIDDVTRQRDSGFISTNTAIKKLYPDWTDEDIKKEMEMMAQEGGLNGNLATN